MCSAGFEVVTHLFFSDLPRHHVICCVLQILIAIGFLLCVFMLRSSPHKHKEVKEVLRIAPLGWNITAAGSPDGEETKCLLEVWPHIASTLGIKGSKADAAVLQISNLIRQLYRLWQFEGEALSASLQVRSFIDGRIVFDQKTSIERFVLIEQFVSIDAPCRRYLHPLNHNPHRSQRSRQGNLHNHQWHCVGI